MTLTLPDGLIAANMTAEELRLELACALYARGKIGKTSGAALAGVDFFTFQKALGERQISTYTREALEQEMATLNEIFPEKPLGNPKG